MEYLKFKHLIDRMRAHELAVKAAGARQVHCTVQFYETGASVFYFTVCFGACRKCDRAWIELRMLLSGVKVVQVDPPKPAAPAKP